MSRQDAVSYEEVIDLLESWEPTFHSYTVAAERMQLYLDRALNPDPIEAPQRAEIDAALDEAECDPVVNDEIGINIYRKFSGQEFTQFRQLINDCSQQYVIMYA